MQMGLAAKHAQGTNNARPPAHTKGQNEGRVVASSAPRGAAFPWNLASALLRPSG